MDGRPIKRFPVCGAETGLIVQLKSDGLFTFLLGWRSVRRL
jgi:hypothetical protein